MEKKLDLKELIGEKDVAAVLRAVADSTGSSITVQDAKGGRLMGEGRPGGDRRFPVEVKGELIGWVRGNGGAAMAATLLGCLAASKLRRRGLAESVRAENEKLTRLHEIARRMFDGRDVREIAGLATSEVGRFIKATSASIMLLNEETRRLEIVAAQGQEYHPKISLRPGEGIAGDVFDSGKAEVINDVRSDPRYIEGAMLSFSLMCVPLRLRDRVIGVFNVSNEQDGYCYNERDVEVLEILALYAAGAVQNALYRENRLGDVLARTGLGRYISPKILKAGLEGKNGVSLDPVKKDIAILFSDIRNFSGVCEKLPPERIVEYLNEYFTCMVDVIFGYGGTLNKFVGDMIVALFGAPVETINNERLAVETAIDMQRRLRTIPVPFIREHFSTGIGIGSGEVIVGNIGSPQHMDYTAIGDEVNVAERLQALAGGGQILVTRRVYEYTADSFRFREVGCMRVKGREKPVEIFEVVY